MFVTVVPIFAPIIIGIAIENGSLPLATMATINDVVTELLCASVVARIPVTSPRKGLLAAVINESIVPFPSPLIPPARVEIPTRNRNRKAAARKTLNIVGLGRFVGTSQP